MDLAALNARVDQALNDNRRAEHIVIGMSCVIFLVGVAVIVVSYWQANAYIASGGIVVQGLLYWPINEILKIRKDNIILQTLPTMAATLPPDKFAEQIVATIEYIRKR